MTIQKSDSIFIAGHRGLVGSAILRRFRTQGYDNLILRARSEIDLRSLEQVNDLFRETHPSVVVIAAARVGGIAANVATPVEFLTDNLEIQNNLLLACREFRVTKTVFMGSSCIYPRDCPQPMREDHFMTGPLEPTNESYAIAKIAGIRLARALHEQDGLNVICPMPSNVYGPGDHFDLDRAHVVSALVRRFWDAANQKHDRVTLWGTGSARREFLHVDDLASAVLFLLEHLDSPEIINVGSGVDLSIRELAAEITDLVGFDGEVEWDTTKPDGMPRKLLDVTKVHALGWRNETPLREGLRTVIEDYEQRSRRQEFGQHSLGRE